MKSHVSQLIRKVLSNDDMIQNLVQNEITTIFKTNEMLLTLQDIDLYTSCHNILFGILFGPAVHESSEVQDIIRRHKLKTKPSCDPAEWYTCSSWLLFQGSTNTLDPSYSEDIKKIIQVHICIYYVSVHKVLWPTTGLINVGQRLFRDARVYSDRQRMT